MHDETDRFAAYGASIPRRMRTARLASIVTVTVGVVFSLLAAWMIQIRPIDAGIWPSVHRLGLLVTLAGFCTFLVLAILARTMRRVAAETPSSPEEPSIHPLDRE